METLFSLLPIVLGLVVLAVAALLWAIRSGQFDDLEGPAYRILHDDDDPRIPFNREQREAGEGEQENRADDGDEKGQSGT
ncbi:cbb3-type cytochrome oxidase assembly protein CcoS [Thiohalorhabdus methylotrophus]|uniref:Cbb3-type cytochrome oxidase assembly protein CcoS n=1 Tax=Thiohalorhabdus methylotrophus TaxID=3242694 RepID=A0ABV4TS14_9GAMM